MRTTTLKEKRKMMLKSCLSVVAFFLAVVQLSAQQKTVSGKVVNAANNQPIVKASVQVKGSRTRGTSTDELGQFNIALSTGETIIVSSLNFDPQELKYTGQVVLNVQLKEATQELQTVVVTALGIKREEKALGYAVSKVNTEQLTDARSNNWTNALQGKVAGLNLIKSGGGPAGSNKIILRGENSLGGSSEALIVVDGVIISGSSGKQTGMKGSGSYLDSDSPTDFGSSLSDLNPDDIETVTVLKGPGAAALYGARGANGAVVITTKSGRGSQKGLGVTFSSNLSFESIPRWPDYQYEYGQGAAGQDTWYSYNATADGASTRSTSSAWGPKFDGQQYYQYDPVTRTTGATRTNWVPYKNNHKDYFQQGKTFTNSISIEGGNSSGTNARLSITNLQNDWIVPNTGYKRTTVALSVNQKVNDQLTIASKVNYTNRSSDNLPSTGYNNQSIMYFIRGLTPNMDINWFKDYWAPGQEQISQTRPFSSLLDNPYLIAYEMLNKSNRNGIIGNISATYNFTKDLSLMLRSSIDYSTESRSQQRPKSSNKFVDGMYRTQNIYTTEITNDFLLRYGKKFGSKFGANLSFGGSQMRNKYNRDEVRADKLLYPGVYTFANSKNLLITMPYRSQYAVNSLYGLAQFSYSNFLFLDITGRNDWSSTLATPTSVGNASFFYPSFNLSAVLSDAFHLPTAINYLKLRGSWSSVGSGGTSPYLTAYAYDPTLFPSGLSNPLTIANPDLRYLTTQSLEFGLETRLFKSRLSFDISVYRNKTKDQIASIPVDRATGYNGTVLNSGAVQNQGIEIQANGTLIKNKNFSWTAFGTFTANDNKVLSLADSIETYVLSTGPANRGSIEARPGGHMGDLYGLGYERSPDGQIVYNAQGIPVLSQTIKYLGNTMPKWKGSLGTEFKYKSFGLSVLFDAQFGAVAYSLTTAVLSEEGKLAKTLPGRYNGITGDGVIMNPDGTYRKNDVMATSIQAYYNGHFNRDNVESNTFSTDYIKFREARLDYTLPASLLKKLHLTKANIGIYGRDLFMFTKWPAFDPEVGSLGVSSGTGEGQINAGFELGQFPATRSIGVALTVGF